jgi:hypothetical protein
VCDALVSAAPAATVSSVAVRRCPTNGGRVFVKSLASSEGSALGEICTLARAERSLYTFVLDNFLGRKPPQHASHA